MLLRTGRERPQRGTVGVKPGKPPVPEKSSFSEGGGQCRELVSMALSKSVTSLRVGAWIEGHLVEREGLLEEETRGETGMYARKG